MGLHPDFDDDYEVKGKATILSNCVPFLFSKTCTKYNHTVCTFLWFKMNKRGGKITQSTVLIL